MGEQVTYRDADHTDPHDDVIQLWISDGRLYDAISPTFKDEVTQLRDDVLGPENERQHGSPRKTTKGKIIGGFHFERSFHRSRPVRDDGSRCYQYQGLSMEKPRAVSSVNANSKLPDDKDRQLWNRMLKTYAAIGIVAMKLAPESVQRAAQLKADLVNSPLIAQDDNFYHRKSQINMSQAQMYNGPLTITDLGPSGDRHNDNNDEESGYSNASVHLHLPVEYHPGLFMFYELGRIATLAVPSRFRVKERDADHTDPHDDVIQLWISDGRLYDAISPTFKDEVTQLRDDVLGPENERQHGSPRQTAKGKIIGGFHFDVNANSKSLDDKDCQLRNRMLKMYAAIGVVAMKLAPESVQRAAQLKADLVNSPLITQDNNFYHHESQINMSQAQMYDGPLTITDLGPSGDRHNDNNDEESGYSNTSGHSHLPAEYHPGLFMFYELGLRYHRGTPPTAPPGVTPPAWNACILIIQYPARHLMNMSVRQSLAALPGGAILYVTPEMQEHRVPKKKYRLWSTRATYVPDGYDLLLRKAHTVFVARLLLRLCQHTLRGMPNNVKIDLNMFLSSIKYQDENGDMCSIELWRFGELIANMSAKEQKEYSEAWDIVDRHAASTCIFIPHVAQHKEAHIQDKTFCRLAQYKGPCGYQYHPTLYLRKSN
ncbi:hypothetical protein K439DRAFT_1622720 [Ramaria rubella]|nr:hypothetical protein K439DRAFT_1622720 [Ramaria rubella]